jgi:hypothetical protein
MVTKKKGYRMRKVTAKFKKNQAFQMGAIIRLIIFTGRKDTKIDPRLKT